MGVFGVLVAAIPILIILFVVAALCSMAFDNINYHLIEPWMTRMAEARREREEARENIRRENEFRRKLEAEEKEREKRKREEAIASKKQEKAFEALKIKLNQ